MVKPEIKKIVLVTHSDVSVAALALEKTLKFLAQHGCKIVVPPNEWSKHKATLNTSNCDFEVIAHPEELSEADLCFTLGGDGTILRALHLTRDLDIPVAGVNLGRVGFLTTISPRDLEAGLVRLLQGDFLQYPLLGLEATLGQRAFRATNDVAIGKGDRATACSLSISINGMVMFEALCDGMVAATPVGSSAYSLAAGGPLLGISVEAFVICLVAPHLVGVRPVVLAPGDLLEVTNTDHKLDCCMDVDGQRLATLNPGDMLSIKASPAMASLALLSDDSLYQHFRDCLL